MSEIRKFIPVLSEYKQAIAVESANFPDEEISVESWKWHDQHFDPNTVFSRWVGEADNKIISHGLFTQLPEQSNRKTQHFMLHIAVHPEQQRKGYGSELFKHLNRHLQQYLPCTIETVAREDKPQSVHFLENRNFKLKAKQHIARLTIPQNSELFDISPYSKHLSSLGIHIDPLSALMQDDTSWQQKLDKQCSNILRELQESSSAFLPGLYGSGTIFDGTDLADPHHIFVARYHEHWIGLAGIRQSEKYRHSCVHTLTGVDRPYRRNGIATTLMQHCINAAIQSGYHFIESYTQKESAIYQIQQKLGYISQPITIHYELSLS